VSSSISRATGQLAFMPNRPRAGLVNRTPPMKSGTV
jgi:hypothetical protein